MARRWIVLVVVAVLAGAAGIAIGASFGDDDGGGGDVDAAATATTAPIGPPAPSTTGPSSVPAPAPFATTGLTGAALELAEAYNRALQLTYHAHYETAPAADVQPVVVDIYRRPPFARRDTTTGSGAQGLDISEYRTTENAHVGCVLSPDEGSQDLCVVAPGGSVDPADPIMGVIDPTTATVTASDATIAGVAARCFEAPAPNGTARACFDADGIPVSIDGGDGDLLRVSVERGVDDEVFVLPAAPSESPTAGATIPPLPGG